MKWGAIMKKKYYELTAPQKSIWLTEQYYKNTNINNVCGTFYSDEILDFEILKKALNTFLQSNDSFRIKLHFTEDKVVQYFSDLENIDFKIIDIKNKNEQSTLEENMASKVFTMLDSLLFEIVLFRYPDNHGGFVMNSHHLISDSWTNGIVANDVALIYSKIKNNELYEKDKSLSYIEYIDSEKKYIESNKFHKDKEYWNNLFSTIPEVATIPSLKDSIKDDDITANRILLDIGTELFAKLKNYCSENKVSLYNFFMSVFALYLGRVSNLDEFVIGTPILNRTNYKEKETTGMFINTLPLKVTLSHEKTFLDNLKDIAVNSMSLLRHQKYSFQYLIEDLRKKDSNLPKLYNVLYSYQITKMNDNMDSLSHITSWAFNKTISDDLDIHMFEWNDNDSIQIAYDYRTSKYDEQDISDLHARILHVINQILENNNILLKDIEIVTPEEKHQILFDFNNTKSDYPKDKTIVDLFEEQVEKTPDNIAVVFEDQKLTYRELNEKANQLAYVLQKNNVKIGDIIGVFMPKSLDLIISIFSILKCGAVYMPMCTEYPKDRLEYMINNSNSQLVISDNDSISFSNCVTINCNQLLQFSKSFLTNKTFFDSDSLAYVIYTSGSTGNPKGVKISHRNLINFIYSFKKYYNNEISSKDSFLAATNIAFDVSIWEIFMPILNGARLVFNTEEIIKDISLYTNNIINNNITAMYIPPNILDETFTILNKRNYTKLSKLLVGVESITNTTLNKYIKLNPNIKIVNGYGPTETTICATALQYKYDNTSTHIIPIGKPLYNNKVYILSHSSLCPPNVPGELYVAGVGVGHGYLNNTSKTNSVFIEDLFFKNNLMYNTGDLAYWDSTGLLHFIGRKDNQIKLHGYRIELSEIDSKLNTYPDIQKSFSIVKNNNIITYYLSKDEINSSILKSYLSESLPFYMIPSFFIRLSSFPLTPNGKIDKKLLPIPKRKKSDYVEPTTEVESLLCKIWMNLFNKDKIGINDNFFEIGGDSLTAIKFQTEALKYNIDINYGDIFSSPTIKELASLKSSNSFIIDSSYNYTNINKALSINTLDNISSKPLPAYHSAILLLGATGFLGAHILDNILTNTTSKVYCLIRNKNQISNTERLRKIINYYFGDKYNKLFDKRIIVVDGDITKKDLGLDSNCYKNIVKHISCVLNSAALVKHYGNINDFNNINIHGTKNVIDFCMKNNKKLYHISTISVSGLTKYNIQKNNTCFFKETNLYINQNLNNAYIYTKFQAEISILEAIEQGLNATILRLGNISNRYSDGKFQINFSDNAYLNRMKSFISMEMIPDNFINHAIDFSPVDFCADAIVKIVFSKNNFTVFHIFNTNLISFANIVSFLNDLNYNIYFTSDTLFKQRLLSMLDNKNEKKKISGIIPDLDSNKNLNLIFDVVPNADFSIKFLEKLNFSWPIIDINYFSQLVLYFKTIGYFD